MNTKKHRPWWRLHSITILALLPIIIIWTLLAVPGMGPQNITPPGGGIGLTAINLMECQRWDHGWPFVHWTRMNVTDPYEDDDAMSEVFPTLFFQTREQAKNEFIKTISATVDLNELSTAEPILDKRPYWLERSNWYSVHNVSTFSWAALLINILFLVVGLLSTGLFTEFWIRRFGARFGLIHIAILMALIGGGLTYVRYLNAAQLAPSDVNKIPGLKFRGLDSNAPNWTVRLLGGSAFTFLSYYKQIEVYYSANLEKDWWNDIFHSDRVEQLSVKKKFGEPNPVLPDRFFSNLGMLHRLNRLVMEECDFDPALVIHLEKLQELKFLQLNHCTLDSNSVETFAKLVSLEYLNVTGSGLDSEDIVWLRIQRPEMQIIY